MNTTAEAYREAARFLSTLDIDQPADILITEAKRLDEERDRQYKLGDEIADIVAEEPGDYVAIYRRVEHLLTAARSAHKPVSFDELNARDEREF